MNLFELKTVVINGDRRRDGSYKTFEQSMGIFSTRSNAERFMRERMVEEKYFERVFAFFIYRKELNGALLHPGKTIGAFLEAWSYFGDGRLYGHCACDEAGEQPFYGRSTRTIRLRKSDLAWYMGHDRIVPCMVSYQPMTDVEYRKRARELGHDLGTAIENQEEKQETFWSTMKYLFVQVPKELLGIGYPKSSPPPNEEIKRKCLGAAAGMACTKIKKKGEKLRGCESRCTKRPYYRQTTLSGSAKCQRKKHKISAW